MKTKSLLVLSLAAALVAGGFTVLNAPAANATGRPGAGHGRLLERAKEKLGLTDEQAAQIKAILKSEKENLTGLMTRLHDVRSGLREAIRSANATEASVRSASAKVAAVEADLAVERLKLYGKISPILTDDQRAKLADLAQRMDELVDSVIARAGERLAE
jgi:Spy/CpxP family protein refolding chaperone